MKQYKVGIIGATGMVGQRFATLLEKPSMVYRNNSSGKRTLCRKTLRRCRWKPLGYENTNACCYERHDCIRRNC